MKVSKRKDKEKKMKLKQMEVHRKEYFREQKLLEEAGFITKKTQNGIKNEKTDEITTTKRPVSKRIKGREYTVSVALPGSILDNAQSPELRTYLAGQIARACVVFQVDEIVIFDDASELLSTTTDGNFSGIGKKGNSCIQLARILQYLECPQYLRKSFFPKHPDLQYAGLLNPLDCPHHMRMEDYVPYREGVVLSLPGKPEDGSYVNCGARKMIQIDRKLNSDLRVTIRMPKKKDKKKYGTVVSPETPRTEEGLYWGYTVRIASCLNKAISDCPFKDASKYDLTIGTSERGQCVDNAVLPSFKHALVVFGGVQGLEAALESDESIMGVDNPKSLFDFYFNTCPNQGSRTIRTEEAVLVTMSSLRPKLTKAQS